VEHLWRCSRKEVSGADNLGGEGSRGAKTNTVVAAVAAAMAVAVVGYGYKWIGERKRLQVQSRTNSPDEVAGIRLRCWAVIAEVMAEVLAVNMALYDASVGSPDMAALSPWTQC